MAWLRKGRKSYYYQSKRDGKQVRSSYVGSGETAELIAQFDELEREQAEQERQDRRRQAAKEQATDEQIEAFGKLAADYVKALLIVTGHHQHKRQWRKRRGT